MRKISRAIARRKERERRRRDPLGLEKYTTDGILFFGELLEKFAEEDKMPRK